MFSYLSDPRAIYRESFLRIEGMVDVRGYGSGEGRIVRRVVHATADVELALSLRFHPDAVRSAKRALEAREPVVVDANMVAAGISPGLLERLGISIFSWMADPSLEEVARAKGMTRAMALVDRLAGICPEGAIVVVGNAPTALFRVLELTAAGTLRPSLIIGVPVGLVGAKESKEALAAQTGVPYITNVGPRGGSPMAVAIMNALLRLVLGEAEI